MNKKDLIDQLAPKTRLLKTDLETVVNMALELIESKVASGEDVTLSGFGTFSLLKRKARNGYNPHTGEEIRVPEILLPKFKPGKDFRKAVEKKSAI